VEIGGVMLLLLDARGRNDGVKHNGFMVNTPVCRSIQRNPIHPQLLVPKGLNHFFGDPEGNVL
jgi:hypothetical protein